VHFKRYFVTEKDTPNLHKKKHSELQIIGYRNNIYM
jgi:hypothetical protein